MPKVKLVILVSLIKMQPSIVQLSALKVTDVKPLQLEKALTPIEVMVLGMVTEVRPAHLPNAVWSMEVTE